MTRQVYVKRSYVKRCWSYILCDFRSHPCKLYRSMGITRELVTLYNDLTKYVIRQLTLVNLRNIKINWHHTRHIISNVSCHMLYKHTLLQEMSVSINNIAWQLKEVSLNRQQLTYKIYF